MHVVEERRASDEAVQIRPVAEDDWETVARIFNLYVERTFAAYPDEPVESSFFRDRHEANVDYPFVVAELERAVVGFAYLAPFHAAATMRRSATVTYFLDPDHTGMGIGSRLLSRLLEEGRNLGVDNVMAHVSSLNEASIRFHLQHGFTECGRFVGVGSKRGRPFDMVWLQRTIA
jgi:phosphinothricin acetyltransferase